MAGGRCRTVVAMLLGSIALVIGCGSDDSPEPVDSLAAIGFAEKLAPLVHVHEGERLFPISAESFIDHSKLLWSDGELGIETLAVGRALNDGSYGAEPTIKPIKLGDRDAEIAYEQPLGARPGCPSCRTLTTESSDDARPYGADRDEEELRPAEGFLLDLNDDLMPGVRDVKAEDGQAVMRAPVYLEITEEGKRFDRLLLTYWMLFGSEQPAAGVDAREGDWERVAVLVRRRGASYEPVHVRYYQRGRRHDVPWESAEVVEAGPGELEATHPVVYLGRGDHTPHTAPVDRAQTIEYAGQSAKLSEQAEACDKCPQWRTWEHLIDADTEPWYLFGGAWGALGTSSDDTGPPGPSFFVDR